MIYWRKGEFREGPISLGLDSPAFRFGTGVFETLYYNGNTLCHLGSHLDRLSRSLIALDMAPDMPPAPMERQAMEEIILAVVKQNSLSRAPARINLYCMAEKNGCGPLVTARPHTPEPNKTMRLHPCPEHHVSSLNRHKTMNHMFHARALQLAEKAGFDGSLLTDFEGNVLEAHSSALVFSRHGRLLTSSARPRLPSTALAMAKSVLDITEEPVRTDDLSGFDHAYALNSIMGMRPVTAIGDIEYAPDETTCERGTKAILCL